MVRYRRNFVPGGTFFFTVTLQDRRSSALAHHIDLLRAAFGRTRKQRPFTVDAIVVLPDHLHTIWTLPADDADFSGRWRSIKSDFTRQMSKRDLAGSQNRKGEFDLWQRRYWEHTIRDDADFERCTSYIHFNPVKHGFVSAPAQWPFSSLHRYVREGTLPSDWGGNDVAAGGSFGERTVIDT